MRDRIDRKLAHFQSNQRIKSFTRRIFDHSTANSGIAPVIFFNASTRIEALSLNAAFSLLAAWSLHLQGIPVHHFICRSGMTRCVLGTDRDDPASEPPCRACQNQSKVLFGQADHTWFEYIQDTELENQIESLSLDQLMKFQFRDLPLGELALPSLRWTLRRHNLEDDASTREFFRHFIRSSWNIAVKFDNCIEVLKPQGVVVFNGQFFPEAVVRHIASRRGIRVISHEVALQPFSGYFTDGEATAYPIDIPDSFNLNAEQNKRLDDYLAQRFQGEFSMAGIRFWPKMQALSSEFLEKADRFKQIVPVFTNVVFDTSQGHANVLYPHMFAWLDDVLGFIKDHTETFFIIRAHPDEDRLGKESRESVADWVKKHDVDKLPNVHFVDSSEYFSSYELIQKSKFVMVYNSTIGLEASILGVPVLCAGKARFTQLPTVFFPGSQMEYRRLLEEFLASSKVVTRGEFQANARRFLYFQLFRTSLPFDEFLEEDGIWRGFVRLKEFKPADLLPDLSETMQVISSGILNGKSFIINK